MKMKMLLTMGALLLSSCTHAVCNLPLAVNLPRGQSIGPQDIPVSVWAALLMRGLNYDCTGATLPSGVPIESRGEPMQALVHVDESTHTWLVWVKVSRQKDGQVSGPIARVRLNNRQAEVLNVGMLTLVDGITYFEQRLVGKQVIVAVRSDTCDAAQANRTGCRSQLALLRQQGDRLVVPQVQSGAGSFSSPAIFDLERHQQTLQHNGNLKEMTQITEASFNDSSLVLREQVTVEEVNSRLGLRQLSHRSEVDRSVYPASNNWQCTAPPLWDRIQPNPDFH